MSERGPGPRDFDDVADAVVESRSRPSIIWLIPLVAALVGAFVAYRAYSERGPLITITFKTAGGLEAGKTKVKYKDVEIGVVEEVALSDDLSSVMCKARMVKGADEYLKEKTQFWVVEPRISGGQVSGLATLLSGAYIGTDPMREGKRTRKFVGLDEPPIVTAQEAGRFFVLQSDAAGALQVGSPVFFRRIEVGQVVTSALDAKADTDTVTTRIFVRAPYDARVHASSHFWNASGIDMSLGADGVKIDTQSLVSILIGGIAFDTAEEDHGAIAAAETVFPLYESRSDAESPHFTKSFTYVAYFDQSVRGLTVGAPVEFRGITVGQVLGVKLEFDRKQERFRIPVTIAVQPERFTKLETEAERREVINRLVASGMRAQLKSGNLLTGQLIVGLDVFKGAKPAQVAWDEPIPVFPTIPTPLEEITANVTHLIDRLSKIPVEEIGDELNRTLIDLRGTLAETEKTVASANALISPESSLVVELRRTLLEVSEAARSFGLAADQIQAEPDSLIFGKKGSK